MERSLHLLQRKQFITSRTVDFAGKKRRETLIIIISGNRAKERREF